MKEKKKIERKRGHLLPSSTKILECETLFF